jgi:hypothetical protein
MQIAMQISLVSLKINGAFVNLFNSVCVPVEARESDTMVLLRVVLAGFMQMQFSSRLWGSASCSNSFHEILMTDSQIYV